MRRFEYKNNNFLLESEVEFYFEKHITKFGNGAKVDAPKEHTGKRVIVLVVKE